MSIRRNVQQQNLVTFEVMLATATNFRSRGVAMGIRRFFDLQGIDIDRSAIVSAQSEGYMLGFDFGLRGLLVTSERRFYCFELELDSSQDEVADVHEFVDVTARQNDSEHNRGTGKGGGSLALAVLETLNSTST